MTGFNDRFGGTQIQPAQVELRELSPSTSIVLQWPPFATTNNEVVAQSMVVTPQLANIVFTMPDAREVTPGEAVVWYNLGAFPYTVSDAAGTPISTVQPGERRLIVLSTNGLEAGTWVVTLLGVGIGNLDVAGAAGAGLKAIGTTLNLGMTVETVASSRTLVEADRAKILVWNGGTGTLTLPNTGSLPDFNVEIRNQGTGALTIQPSGGELIDGVASLIFNNTESAWVHSDTGAWYTVGRGRNAQFNFTQLVKPVTGGTVILTLTEAANVVQTYTGVLTADVQIVLPSVVQVYYVSNQTSGAFNMLFRNSGVGSTISLPQGQNAVLFSDGVNVINASTTVAGIGAITFGPGTVATPSVQIGAVNTGFYSPGGGQVGFSSAGVQTVLLSATGVTSTGAGNVTTGATSTGSNAFFTASRPAGASAGMMLQTLNSPRWFMAVDAAPESGANAGSNYTLNRYNDAGVLIDAPVTVNRATGAVTVREVRVLSDVGEVVAYVGDAIAHLGTVHASGALLSRTAYPELWAYAQVTGVVSEATWSGGFWGRFSVGNGSTTFRIPDLRGVFIRGLDAGRGLQPTAYPWGQYQPDQFTFHGHGVSDPTHAHGVSDPGHAHGISDPSHQHGGSGTTSGVGDHTHGYTGPSGTTTTPGGGAFASAQPTGLGTSGAGAHSHTYSFGTDFRFTGIGINGAGTGIGIFGAGTGIAIQGNGGNETNPKGIMYPYYIKY